MQKLMQELHQQVEQFEQRYNDLLAHVRGAVAISADLTEKLDQLDRLREQMEQYNRQMRAGGNDIAGSSGDAAGGAPTLVPTPPS
ncbi:hypothetical protein AHAS_Ahas20G0253900 [Arachis hypogaea]